MVRRRGVRRKGHEIRREVVVTEQEEVKHTRGPWYPDPPGEEDRDRDWRIISTDGFVICEGIWGMGIPEDQANAYLLASSPLLKKRLTEARDAIASLHKWSLGFVVTDEDGSAYPLRDEILDHIDDALEKSKTGVSKYERTRVV